MNGRISRLGRLAGHVSEKNALTSLGLETPVGWSCAICSVHEEVALLVPRQQVYPIRSGFGTACSRNSSSKFCALLSTPSFSFILCKMRRILACWCVGRASVFLFPLVLVYAWIFQKTFGSESRSSLLFLWTPGIAFLQGGFEHVVMYYSPFLPFDLVSLLCN